jgi:DNA-binding SARP family transcriptional activator
LRTAEDYYVHADCYWASVGNTGLRAMSLNSKGGTQHLMGRFQEAHATLSTALQYAREAAMPSYQAAVLSNLGDLYRDLQLWDLARTAYEDARRIGGSAYLMHCLELSCIHLLTRQHQYQEAASKLRQVPDTVREVLPYEVLLLESIIACGLQRYDQAAVALQAITTALTASDCSLMTLARAYLVQAQLIARTTPSDCEQMIVVLEQAVQVAQRLGHDAFLVTEMLHMRDVQRRAAMAGWAPSEVWHLRQQDMLRVAHALGQNDERPLLTIRTLGVDQILLNDQEVNLGWHKAREVLYYLLAHPAGVPIDTLREAIWPNLLVERSRDTLRSAIYQLRSVLLRELITLQGRQLYRIDRSVVRIHCDSEQFLQTLDKRPTEQEALFEALDLYHGPFLPTVENEWPATLRAYLERRYLEALRQAAVGAEADKELSVAMTFYRRILAIDGLDEAAHAGVMRCLIALGNRSAAIYQYQLLRRSLDEELGIDPGPDSEAERLYLHALNA